MAEILSGHTLSSFVCQLLFPLFSSDQSLFFLHTTLFVVFDGLVELFAEVVECLEALFHLEGTDVLAEVIGQLKTHGFQFFQPSL